MYASITGEWQHGQMRRSGSGTSHEIPVMTASLFGRGWQHGQMGRPGSGTSYLLSAKPGTSASSAPREQAKKDTVSPPKAASLVQQQKKGDESKLPRPGFITKFLKKGGNK